jgi:hypothetical protein
MLYIALRRSSHLVRSNKGRGIKFKAMPNLELKKGHFPRRIKLMLPLWRNQVRRRRRKEHATHAVRRATYLLHALWVTHPTLS